MLRACGEPLHRAYDLAMLDLDGVVYIGGAAVPGVADELERATSAGMRVAFITNNAARTPETVAEHLTRLGVRAAADDVVTSSQAAARVLVEQYGERARVSVLGSEGLAEVIDAAGLVPVGIEDESAAVVTGYGPDVVWRQIMQAGVRIRDGLPWVACNTDRTIPTPDGIAPGHGTLVDLLRGFSGVEPVVAGKPARPLLDETVRRVGGRRPLMVGDRLDTDIEGAVNAGHDSLLVLTGVTGLAELVAAAPGERPSYISPTLAGLGQPHPAPEREGDHSVLGGWSARVADGALATAGSGEEADWWRVVADAAWRWNDEHGAVPDVAPLTPPEPGAPASTQ